MIISLVVQRFDPYGVVDQLIYFNLQRYDPMGEIRVRVRVRVRALNN
jgi:hypothetical protein